MSENQQEATADAVEIPAAPGHHGGPPPPMEAQHETREADEVAAGHPDRIEPRAGRDK
jgi:hypothetical protein